MSTVRLNLVRLEQRLRSKVDDDFWGILRNLVVSQSFPLSLDHQIIATFVAQAVCVDYSWPHKYLRSPPHCPAF